MNFETQFKILYLLILEIGGDYEKVFDPKMEECSMYYDAGDTETAFGMLKFIGEKVVELLEMKTA